MRPKAIIAIFLAAALSCPLLAEEQAVFIDRGACPGERCTYCALYVADTDIVVYESPSHDSKQIGRISSGDALITKTGEVHTVPGHFTVFREFEQFKPGDEVYVLTYTGEGIFRVRHNGELIEAELGFSPWGGSWNGQCENGDSCWGGLDKELKFTWWLYVVSEMNVEGWIAYSSSLREIGLL